MSTPIPQPPGTFFIGNLNEIDSNYAIGSLRRLHTLYGDIYR
ncbi:unnamed protein product, partial [Rotaria magnacalcarata]